MRKPANWHHAIMFDPKFEQSMTNRKSKSTRLKNMLATLRPVYVTYCKIRVRVSIAYGDIVYLDNGYKVSIDKLSLFRHTR